MYFCTANMKGLWEAKLRDGDWEGPAMVRAQGVLTLQNDVFYKCVGL